MEKIINVMNNRLRCKFSSKLLESSLWIIPIHIICLNIDIKFTMNILKEFDLKIVSRI